MNCNQALREISEYLDGELTADLRRDIERHLDDCKHCRTVLDQVRMTIDIFCGGQKLDLPQDVSSRLHEAVKRRLGGPKQAS